MPLPWPEIRDKLALKDLRKRIKRFGFIAGYAAQEIKPQDPVNVRKKKFRVRYCARRIFVWALSEICELPPREITPKQKSKAKRRTKSAKTVRATYAKNAR